MNDPQPRKSDLGVRTLSAIVMLAVAGGALWAGGWYWAALAGLVAVIVLWEWRSLVRGFGVGPVELLAWNIAGIVYLGIATATLMVLRDGVDGFSGVLAVLAMVIATDVGAYFAGRTIGGPKIAPKISPSKTWAGLGGGMLASGAVAALLANQLSSGEAGGAILLSYAFSGMMVAIIAQGGDFLESWMKRKAGVKDSGNLIPGHGGFFDRVDGLLAVSFVIGLATLVQSFAA